MNESTIASFIHYVYEHRLLSLDHFLTLRRVSPTWAKIIDRQVEDIHLFMELERKLHDLLYVDDKIYDEFTYNRHLIKVALHQHMPQYEGLYLPGVREEMMADDLADDPEAASVLVQDLIVNMVRLPPEFRIFLNIYQKYPSVCLTLYAPNFLQDIMTIQQRLIEEYKYKDLSFLVLFTPLCHSKHYQIGDKDSQYANVLFHVHIIGKKALELSPDERYYVRQLPMKNLEDMQEHYASLKTLTDSLTRKILQGEAPAIDLAQALQTFDECCESLIKHRQYNL